MEASTSSAASPTRFSAPSSPSSLPWTAPARRPSPGGGDPCGVPPLNLQVDHNFTGQNRKRIAFVSKILSDHPGPARRLALAGIRLRHRYGKIDGWLRSRALTDLREMVFRYEIEDPQLPYPLPPSARRFAPTLCAAEIGNCDFPKEMPPSLNFPCLKQLTLCSVTMSQDALHSLLSSCTVLESLLLMGNNGIASLHVSSPTLRSIGVSASGYWVRLQYGIMLQELVIEDAPCLERLLPLNPNYGPATIWVLWAPKLRDIGLVIGWHFQARTWYLGFSENDCCRLGDLSVHREDFGP
ncbi:hypothetical protein PR202_gb26207 [Eleusine coracana subsp. coracana]|uniref:Uncharacterized protein n=2 Tax=Eleusine coracana subsp. coracana TaxID=191504 RepID=A0AAV5FNB8_ELECO|nr:hypothetical protein QOZ80_UnG0722840 [Eleusine coracana subsp. coracana]GJN37273.1 hypothetical protein PR202_gb26207 [Eleusine coracana subsp. coracana]